jgi:hypothetical protein
MVSIPTQRSGMCGSPLEMLGYDQPGDSHVRGFAPGACAADQTPVGLVFDQFYAGSVVAIFLQLCCYVRKGRIST